jgi:hypothetical protein
VAVIRKQKLMYIAIGAIFVFFFATLAAIAITNPPHDASNLINCDNCHFYWSAIPPWWDAVKANIDDDPVNRVCWQANCHDGSTRPYIKTHSSLAMNSTQYGTRTFVCTTCHNPHLQRQVYNSDYASALTGTITAVDGGTGTLTLSIALPDRTGDADPVDDYTRWLIVPNTKYRTINYRIASNTANTVTVIGTLKTSRVPPLQMVMQRGWGSARSVIHRHRTQGVMHVSGGMPMQTLTMNQRDVHGVIPIQQALVMATVADAEPLMRVTIRLDLTGRTQAASSCRLAVVNVMTWMRAISRI